MLQYGSETAGSPATCQLSMVGSQAGGWVGISLSWHSEGRSDADEGLHYLRTFASVGTASRDKDAISAASIAGAEEGTRTPTPLRVHGPEPCASANSATSAKVTARRAAGQGRTALLFYNENRDSGARRLPRRPLRLVWRALRPESLCLGERQTTEPPSYTKVHEGLRITRCSFVCLLVLCGDELLAPANR